MIFTRNISNNNKCLNMGNLTEICVRIVSLSYCMLPPNPLLDPFICETIPATYNSLTVPTIRVFGSTKEGQRACLHIHQIFPYLYVAYDGSDDCQDYITRLGSALNYALAMVCTTRQSHFIASITLVKGIPYYGYHNTYRCFLKISLLDPAILQRCAKILQSGAILGRRFDVFEAHLPFLLQFLIDYNLQGMAFIHLSFAKFRLPTVLPVDRVSNDKLLTDDRIHHDYKWLKESHVLRHSYCELELDSWPSEILNHNWVVERPMRHCEASLDECQLVPSLGSFWSEENKRRKLFQLHPASPEKWISQKQRVGDSQAKWYNEKQLRNKINDLCSRMDTPVASANGPEACDDSIPSIFQAIGSLHPPKHINYSDTPFKTPQKHIPSESDFTSPRFVSSSPFKSIAGTPFKSVQGTPYSTFERTPSRSVVSVHSGQFTHPGANERATVDEDLVRQLSQNLHLDEDVNNEYEQINDAHDDIDDGSFEEVPMNDELLKLMAFFEQEELEDTAILPGDSPAKPQDAPLEGENLRLCQEKSLSFLDKLKFAQHEASTDTDDETVSTGSENSGFKPLTQVPQFDGDGGDIPMKSRKRKASVVNDIDPPNNSKKRCTLDDHPCLMSENAGSSNSVNYIQNVQQMWSPNRRQAISFSSVPPIPDSPTRHVPFHQTIEYEESFDLSQQMYSSQSKPNTTIFKFGIWPPTARELKSSMAEHCLPIIVNQKPYFSNPKDIPKLPREIAGRTFRLKGDIPSSYQPFDSSFAPKSKWMDHVDSTTNLTGHRAKLEDFSNLQTTGMWPLTLITPVKSWTSSSEPPSRRQAKKWLSTSPFHKATKKNNPNLGQIPCPTPPNTNGFKYTPAKVCEKDTDVEREYLCIMAVEIHCRIRSGLAPDPVHDAVEALFYCVQSDDESRFRMNGRNAMYHVGMIVVGSDEFPFKRSGLSGFDLTVVPTELVLFRTLIQRVREWDPDILTGYEIQSMSWGYLMERAVKKYGIQLHEDLSALNTDDGSNNSYLTEEDIWGSKKQSSLHSTGRIYLNIWRLMRKELALTSYTAENISYHVLHKRIPAFSKTVLSEWYSKGMLTKWRTMKYFLDRVQDDLDILNATDLINRTSQFAKTFGIDFNSVVTRGSQFRVESVMSRIARAENFVMFSPSKDEIRRMRAFECVPLIMEPESVFYEDPVVVLDFQSLYPSMMIAYNLCYSTLLGKVESLGKTGPLGANQSYTIPSAILEILKHHTIITPNGSVFVKPDVRQGVLGRMLNEILDTRVMVKKSIKMYSNRRLKRVLDAKQLGLKLLANVTYGYTAASFSGRMPCTEIADAIVSCGRHTLENAIQVINNSSRWNAKVVYADTDSIFVSLVGRSKNEAFKIGQQIVDEVTRMNPVPVKLKLEKVYHPCVLLSKKRYVGAMYETPDVTEPVFDAKGIETVRRDGCPAIGKIMERTLKILFRTKDISQVKSYIVEQWTDILAGNVSLHDFIIANEVKLGTYRDANGILPPGAMISKRKMEDDARLGPQYGERVPYIVVYGGSKHRVVDSVFSPYEVLDNSSLKLHGAYYIKQINSALARVFDLIGANVDQWFREMPKVFRAKKYIDTKTTLHNEKTIDQFYKPQHCILCHAVSQQEVCQKCRADPIQVVPTMNGIRNRQAKYAHIERVCKQCTDSNLLMDIETKCISMDCPIFFERRKLRNYVLFDTETYKKLRNYF